MLPETSMYAIIGVLAFFSIMFLILFLSAQKKLRTESSRAEQLSVDNMRVNTILSEKEYVETKLERKSDELGGRIVLMENELKDKIEKLAKTEEKASQVEVLNNKIDEKDSKISVLMEEKHKVQQELEAIKAVIEEERKAFQEKLNFVEDSKIKLKEQFENLANKIFDEKSDKFRKDSAENINGVLNPFKEGLETFKKRVEELDRHNSNERASLKNELENLMNLNRQLSKDAHKLTKALKGDSKVQGGWGEMMLENLLQGVGLREGYEYVKQETLRDESGKSFRPDVIVHMPDDKDIVIDSKVSLTAYEKYYSAEDDIERDLALKDHILSIRNHIKNLSEKNYQSLQGIRTLDYVFMFIPVEGAYVAAVNAEPDLVKDAFEKNIMVAGPTNLLAAMRVVNTVWKYEMQNKNATEIADRAAGLYDKFVSFVEEFLVLESRLRQAQDCFDTAKSRLVDGRGNIVRRFEQIKELGVSPKKAIPNTIAELADAMEVPAIEDEDFSD